MVRRLGMLIAAMLVATQVPALAAPAVNSKCSKIAQRSGTLICTKVAGALVWKKAAPRTSAADSSPPSTGKVVSRDGLIGRTVMGYQGWFACPTDDTGPTWVHWFDYNKPAAAKYLTVDYWPDTSEYSSGELCPTEMTTLSGKRLYAYSGYNQTVVNRHFSWMQSYDIDGVALQRFVSRINVKDTYAHDYLLMQRVSAAAQRYGRVFYFEYDFSGTNGAQVAQVKADWKRTVDAGITKTSAYLHLNGLPLVELWGLGIPDVAGLSATEAADLIAFFKSNPDPKYRASVAGGLGSYWREGIRDAESGPAWAKVYRSFDAINPWSVGRYGSKNVQEAQTYLDEVIVGDLVETQKLGIIYLPVVWPGFSWKNLTRVRGEVFESNGMPRYCGAFYWQQVVNVLAAGARQIFVAMFDEVDEGTAMYKMVASTKDLPASAGLIALDVDGCSLRSDFYLRLAGATARATREGKVPERRLPFPLLEGESMSAPTFGLDGSGQVLTDFSRGLAR